MNQRVSDLLIQAMQRLPRLQSWSSIVAENIYWASCEPFLQSSLLWSINSSDGSLISDRERLLTGSGNNGTKPDLLLFQRCDRHVWVDPATSRSDRLRLGCGFAYVKLAWAKGNATGSATIPAKATAILTDIAQKLRGLHNLAMGTGLAEPKALLVVTGCGSVKGSPDESAIASSQCESELIDRIQQGLAAQNLEPARLHGSEWLAKGERVHSASDRFASLLSSVLDVSVSEQS